MKLKDAIFCDDIRYENNNKISLMGIYNDRILIKAAPNMTLSWPIPLRLAIYLRFIIDEKEEHPNSFEFEYLLNNNQLAILKGNMNVVKEHNFATLTVVANGIQIQLGDLGYRLKLFKDKKEIFSLNEPKVIKIVTE